MTKPKVVLLVDDNEMSRDMLARRLANAQYRVMVAENAGTARELILQQPDVVLLDMMLPDEDGWELATAWKATKETRHIPIVAVSAMALREHIERGLKCGCDAYLTKPIDFKALLAHIKELTTVN